MAVATADCETRIRPAALAVGVLATALLLLGAAPRAEAACSADYCFSVTTDADGTYTLNIPAGVLGAFYPELADCAWKVEAQFGDGSEPALYTFSAGAGLSESHDFPAPGTYQVHIYAAEGVHGESGGPCPDLHLEGSVTYPQPASGPPPEEPEEPQEPGQPGEPIPPGLEPTGPGPVVDQAGRDLEGSPKAGAGGPRRRFWRICGDGVSAHRVRCRPARRIARRAARLLELGGGRRRSARIGGFRCRLSDRPGRRLLCRRGGRLVRALPAEDGATVPA